MHGAVVYFWQTVIFIVQVRFVSKTYHWLCSTLYLALYRIASNKRSGTYFLQGLQAPVVKRDWAFIWALVLISYRLFRRYAGPTTFANCGAPTLSMSASSRRPPTTAAMAFFYAPRTLTAKQWDCFPPSDAPKNNHLTNVKQHSLDTLITRRMADCLTQILHLSFACIRCVRHAHFGPWCLFETRRLFLSSSETPGV